jgi:putative ABC transport system substrate-binding protein
LGLATEIVHFENPPYDLTVAVADAAASADAILTVTSPVLYHQREELFAAALDHRIPVFFGNSRSAAQGALMGFGPSLPNLFAGAASYTHRILNGADPAALPIQRPTAYELSVNLQTAAALGIEIPAAILLRANQVIE